MSEADAGVEPMGARGSSKMQRLRQALRGCWLLILAAGWIAAPPPVHAGADVIDAPAALDRARAGELVIIDVRTVDEWAQTGVPEGALEVSLFPQWGVPNRSFVDDILAAVGRDKTIPIALICATGKRSSYAQSLLEKSGFTRVSSISEGMVGSSYGPGWLARGLPVGRCQIC